MTQTIIDNGGAYLVLRVAAAQDHAEGATEDARWCAHVCDPASPLAGLYAFGASLLEVRDGVAMLAWAAVTAGELASFGYTTENLVGIHVAVTTTTPYDAEWLTVAVANDAA
ncbi:MAG TPA: hypothetical protein VFQ85_18520 [Mycobacteriales bacterium]|jgi:hypothetical protein|nr:hypothetical protein [Mycobacteriales bacterium]